MMMNKKALYLAVAASVGAFGASQANAAAATFGSELPSGSALAGATWAVPTTLYAPTTANPMYLSFSLNNGASFAAAPTMTCAAVSGGGSDVTPSNIQLAAGGLGTAVATFVVTAVTAGQMISSCTITNGNVVIGTWPGTVSESVVITYGNALSPTASNSTALLAASSLFSNAATAATNTALVATGFITFSTANAVAGSTVNTANLGSFALQLNANKLSTGNAANATLAMTAIVTGITISLAGAPLVAANSTTGGLFITYQSSVGGATGCGGTKVVSAMGGSSAITFSAIAPGAGGTSGYEYTVCMGVSGAAIPAGTITVGVVGVANTDPVNANGSAFQIGTLLASTTTLGTITRNGSSTEVLNLPYSTNSDAGYLRVYNNAAGAGAVTATVYNEAGTALATNCTLSSSLPSQAAMVTSMANLETTCGITPPTSGRARVVVNGAFSSMRAQGLARTGGVLVNLSADTSGSGN